MKNLVRHLIPIFEILYLPILVVSALGLLVYRRVGSKRLKLSTGVLRRIGVYPIRDHYYEPLFNDSHFSIDLQEPRYLPGVEFNEMSQLELLRKLKYQSEFSDFVEANFDVHGPASFKIDNSSFASGDSEFLFNFIRHIRPSRIIEIGCGTTTKIIQHALMLNEKEYGFRGGHLCVEPYEQPWLEDFSDIELIRQKVEDVDVRKFEELECGDLLFIDSSHMIRPQGDVLYEYLSIIPRLNEGVYVHVHDIFTPNDYPADWIKTHVLFWNEQYLLEALLTDNPNLQVIAALNFLKHRHFGELKAVCTYLTPEREPGSFYFKTI